MDHLASEEPERSSFDLASLPVERLLVVIGGLCAIGFGTLALVLDLRGEVTTTSFVGFTSMGGAVFSFAIALVFGLGLLLAFAKMGRQPAEGAILALAFSVVLLAFGALSGLIAGIVSLVGALTGLVRNLRFTV